MVEELDNVDRGILYMLQLDARNTTSQEIAEKVGVSASTVRNRLERLESNDVVAGYYPKIDYESANYPFRVMFVISAPPQKRGDVVDRLMDIHGVITVREMLTARRNIHVEVVGKSTEEIVRVTDSIHSMEFNVEVESSEIMKQRRLQPFNHFYFAEEFDDIEDQSRDNTDA